MAKKGIALGNTLLSLLASDVVNDEAADRNAYDFRFTAIDQSPLPLADFRGNVILVVNTASLCGFTQQYSGLQRLWNDYRSDGLVVIGVPSNDFCWQEPGSAEEIGRFCKVTFGVTLS